MTPGALLADCVIVDDMIGDTSKVDLILNKSMGGMILTYFSDKMIMYIRVNDIVMVLSGDDKGKRGKVVAINRDKNKVTVQGVNTVFRHTKPSRRNQQGGRLEKEMPIDLSKVALLDPTTGSPTRVGVRYLPDGTKELYAKKSGAVIRTLSKPRAKYAAKK